MALSAWRSPRLFAFILLALAVILGGFYRFHRLARWDMNGDEGSFLGGGLKPTVRQVARTFGALESRQTAALRRRCCTNG